MDGRQCTFESTEEDVVRRIGLMTVVILLALISSAVAAKRSSVVDTFSGKVDSKGLPQGWELRENSGKADFKVDSEKGNHFIRLHSEDTSWTLYKSVDIDVREYPILTWRWKVTRLPKGGDVRRKETDDQAGQLYVQFPRFPEQVRSQIIGYIWDSTAPQGAILKSPSDNPPPTKIVVLQSGEGKVGQWVTERRNVYQDYRDLFGEEIPPRAKRISLWINTQRTKTEAECLYDDIVFHRAP